MQPMPGIDRPFRRSSRRPRWTALGLATILLLALAGGQLALLPAAAEAPANEAFQRTWERTDKPVADDAVSRIWMWGPAANTGTQQEPYAEAPGGVRTVQYFDKGRMEVNSRGTVPAPWDVTTGLLVVEMVNGWFQVGDDAFDEAPEPADIPVAGDPDDEAGPTYRTIAGLLDAPPAGDRQTIVARVDRDGTVSKDPALATHRVTAAKRVQVPGIDHTVASVFWDFMNAREKVYENGKTVTDRLFLNPYYATGYPISEAYWTTVEVGGTPHDVLLQCFERRCLTYTPGNDPGWQVEAGNVGRHYYEWRTSNGPAQPAAAPTATSSPVAGQPTPPPTATSTPLPAPPTNTPAPTAPPIPTATPTPEPPATGYLSIAAVGPNGGINLPPDAVLESQSVDVYAGGCDGAWVGSYQMDPSSFTTVVEVEPGDYCATLTATFTFQTYILDVFASGTGTVEPGGTGYITIVVDANSITLR